MRPSHEAIGQFEMPGAVLERGTPSGPALVGGPAVANTAALGLNGDQVPGGDPPTPDVSRWPSAVPTTHEFRRYVVDGFQVSIPTEVSPYPVSKGTPKTEDPAMTQLKEAMKRDPRQDRVIQELILTLRSLSLTTPSTGDVYCWQCGYPERGLAFDCRCAWCIDNPPPLSQDGIPALGRPPDLR
jgi:hypothetical protein